MKPLLFATLALTATAVGGEALAQSAEAAVTYRKLDGRENGLEGGYNGLGIAGSGVLPLRGRFWVQLDLDATRYESDNGLADTTVFGALTHFHMRDAGWAGGLFAGAAGGDDIAESYVGGYEHYLYYKRVTLGGALGYFESAPVDTEAGFLSLEARYFPIDSLRLDVSTAYATINTLDEDPVTGAQLSADGDLYTFGIGAEYKIPVAPVSLFASAAHGELDARDVTNDSFKIGMRVMTNASLLTRDRSGGSLMSVPAFQDYIPAKVINVVIDPLAPTP